MDDRMRVSDADREAVTARLRDHFAEGRLTDSELDERVSAALNAKTFGELRSLTTDLPGPVPLVDDEEVIDARPPERDGHADPAEPGADHDHAVRMLGHGPSSRVARPGHVRPGDRAHRGPARAG